MNFFSSAVEMLETITAALDAGLQEWRELKDREKCQAITREFIRRCLMRKKVIKRSHKGMSYNMAQGHGPPDLLLKN